METNKSEDRDDAIFDALLKIAANEAAKQEVSEMKSCEELDKIFTRSPEFDERIKKIISEQEKRERYKRMLMFTGKIASGFSIFAVVGSLVLFSVEASRNVIFNAVINMRSDHVVIEFGGTDGNSSNTIYELGYLPLGFEMKENQSAGNLLVKIYENGNGVQIILEINISDMPALGIDTEHTEYTRIAVNEYEAYLFLASRDISFNVLTWATETAVFKLTSSIDIYDLVQIAEKITKK